LLTVAARVLARVRIAGEEFIDPSAAETAVRAVLEQSEAWPTAEVWMPLFEAELSGVEGRGTSVSAWQSAVQAAGGPGAPAHLRPYALYRLAQVQLQAGDRRAAEAAAREARESAADLGAGLVVGWVDALAGRSGLAFGGADDAGGKAVPTPERAIVRLTDRESQVLELIGHGLSNRQIGERLFISTKTASVHVSAILRKLGATSRTEAVYRAQQAGVPLIATD
jgi:DNA-binding CsgD family transcriptional regulator